MLTDKERQRIETLLREERERALGALQVFDESRELSLQEETGELTMYRFHPADLGTEAMEQETQFLLASVEGRRLYEIDQALSRLIRDPERFGVCDRCGRDIPLQRLEVVPEATLCADCQRSQEI
jgi:RNA polymerase-binding transcription factor DksA